MYLSSKKQKGFTLIELVVVIIILGILAVIALPKFINLNKEADSALVKQHMSAILAGKTLFHSKWNIDQQPSTAFSIYQSTPSELGFPAGGDILDEAFESDCSLIWHDMVEDKEPLNFISGSNGWQSSHVKSEWSRNAGVLPQLGETQDNYCHFVYTGGFYNGSFSGFPDDRLLTIQYNIVSGETKLLSWPYSP
ncbi:type II secretion system protein [Shewanella woodyi]|uniref:Methylation site containing protein n=1 Tax=Shewanella woodyi (strain ATCC 51908 / MS32) TaxID=392500 RepID=B1KEY6_SHEWM|nr:type II secretion system protein [Shewanella woodyi]ACA85137.1 hypothetical protein Swoo_0842 [Shewanella woodyi ATCC 51908]